MLIFHREPAVILAFVSALVAVGSNFAFHWSSDQQSLLNAVAAAVVGLFTAWSVDKGGLAAAVMGLASAVLALGLGFGLALDATQQATVMSFVAAVVGMWVRTQVTTQATDHPA
jgi:hypothetical protein